MADKKTITLTALITMAVVSAAFITPNFFDKPKYYCESRTELGIVDCDGFSKYISENGKCLNAVTGNKICREGWSSVINDYVPVNEEDLLLPYKGDFECVYGGCVRI